MSNRKIPEVVTHLHATFESHKTRPYEWRIDQLKSLKKMMVEQEEAIFAALEADLGKSSFESFLTETSGNLTEIGHFLKYFKNLDEAAKCINADVEPARPQ